MYFQRRKKKFYIIKVNKMSLKQNLYKFIFFFFIFLLIIDEFSFILYNISLYQIFCGSNFIKIYESFFKIPLHHIWSLNISLSPENHLENMIFFTEFTNISYFFSFNGNCLNINIIGNDNDFTWDNKFTKNNESQIYLIHFDTLTTQKQKISFDILQNKIYVCPGETNLAFFRICNTTEQTLQAFTIYVVSPTEYTSFINKLQCFCYEELLIYPNETVDLPVLFRLENDVSKIENLNKEIVIEYIIIL
jgi:hypothetical protein